MNRKALAVNRKALSVKNSRIVNGLGSILYILCVYFGASLSAYAQTDSSEVNRSESGRENNSTSIEEVLVEGVLLNSSGLELNRENSAASRLGLSVFELPASVELIDQTAMTVKGDFSGLAAVTRATGIASNGNQGNGGTALSARGFEGHNSVVHTYDGIRLYVGAGTVTFPADTWTVDRVEVLRGPGSVVNGVGAIGASINYVPKKPNEEKYEHQIMLTAGSDDLRRMALGSGGPINSRLSYRLDAVHHDTEGYVDRAEEKRQALAGTLRYRVNDFVAALSMDYAKTEPASYWGTPLVDGAIRDSIRRNNYNAQDGLIEYEDLWPRIHLDWRITDNIRFRNDTFYMAADRQWRNIESYDYNPGSGLVDLSFYLEILHDQEQLGNRSEIQWNLKSKGEAFENKLSVGVELNKIDFDRATNSPYGGGTSVSLHNPRPGFWADGVVDETTLDFTTDTTQYAIFADDQIKLNKYWSIVAGLRYDEIDYKRTDFARSNGEQAGNIDSALSGASWRIGSVYQPNKTTSLYLQYSTAVDSVQSILSANEPTLDLAEGRQIEIGLKQSLLDDRFQHTLAIYDILKKDLLSNDPGGVQRQIGSQSSYGMEWDVFWRPLDYLSLDANLALIKPEYKTFVSGANDFSGNTPRNVPERTANVWLNWLVSERVSLGLGARYVGVRFANHANSAQLPSYVVCDASAQWRINRLIDVTLRGKNLSDSKDYVLSPYYNQWILGDGRTFDLSVAFSF